MPAACHPSPKPATVRAPLTIFCVALLAACGLPRDPEGTLEHVRGGVLRVGLVEDPPWASRDAQSQPRGVEVELTTTLAQALDAEVRWNRGGETRLMAALARFELDLVIGGLDRESAYADKVGFTRPYYSGDGREHVLAVPPGENAWLITVDRHLRAHATDIPARLVAARVAEEAAP